MKKIRKGKTIHLRWPITTNGEAASLEGRNLTLYMTCVVVFNHKVIPFTTDGNVIEATIQGKDMTMAGTCRLTLYENHGKENQTVIDTDAFILVDRTKDEGTIHCPCKPGTTTPEGLETETVDLESGNLEVFTGGGCGCDLTKEQAELVKDFVSRTVIVRREEHYTFDTENAHGYSEVNIIPDVECDDGAMVTITFDWSKMQLNHQIEVENVVVNNGDGPVTVPVPKFKMLYIGNFGGYNGNPNLHCTVELFYPSRIEKLEKRLEELEKRIG